MKNVNIIKDLKTKEKYNINDARIKAPAEVTGKVLKDDFSWGEAGGGSGGGFIEVDLSDNENATVKDFLDAINYDYENHPSIEVPVHLKLFYYGNVHETYSIYKVEYQQPWDPIMIITRIEYSTVSLAYSNPQTDIMVYLIKCKLSEISSTLMRPGQHQLLSSRVTLNQIYPYDLLNSSTYFITSMGGARKWIRTVFDVREESITIQQFLEDIGYYNFNNYSQEFYQTFVKIVDKDAEEHDIIVSGICTVHQSISDSKYVISIIVPEYAIESLSGEVVTPGLTHYRLAVMPYDLSNQLRLTNFISNGMLPPPTAPTDSGTYVLKCIDGQPQWVAE